ncbi:uncharacterized protein Z519_10356 [Cladophialophora bantiana CBS 173.52]|uniref:C3H1-type domain-containing protein n=1 Tax=Cladophialophora bantiana (strain ATCC 10958 / CBS 173.52 / CDC B-1940 / NIH 8579) TaxID=1442370 RepID=A0A0D2FQL5_CLAB1|nr:uncharacterized protein Z519_10356 [Cladophialophora bantiana CBS 173.52]KIW88872.1 hypothetical protein Z519_10356 [Cladophialophora bantiana CBS 173.52]
MDPSTNSTINGAQHAKGQSYGVLDGIQAFTGSDGLQNGDDLSRFFDPELFDSTYSQPSLSMSQDFDPNTGRQSSTPDIQQFSVPQRPFPHHQYSQPFYDSRQMSQPNYDPRFYSGPSPSPVGFDGGYHYPSQMGYSNQQFNTQQMSMPQRQTTTPSQNYPIQQQQQPQPQPQPQPPSFVNIGPRPPHLSHGQNADMMRFGTFQDQTHQPTNHFVDPSMLNANQMMHTSRKVHSFPHAFQTQQPYMATSYFKSGSTVDPRSLQGGQPLQPMSLVTSQTPRPGTENDSSYQHQLTWAGVAIQPKPEQAAKPTADKDQEAPKKKRGRPRKDASAKPDDHPSASETDSDDDLEIEDDEPPEVTPALLSVSMPTDERGKALYNAVQAVWSPRNKSVSPEKIRGGIAGFGDSVRSLRDAWKTKNESLRKAELPNSPTAKDAQRLKEEVARYRQVMENVMMRSLLYGHPAIVKRLGENQFTMSALHSFMLDRFNAADYDSTLVSSILKFVVKFETLDSEMLEMTKLSKILQRLTKKAMTDIKTLAQTVLDNAVAATAKKASTTNDKKADKPASPKSVGSPADGARKEGATGVKRLREGDGSVPPVLKKVAKLIPQSSKPLALQNAERRKALEAAQAAKAGEKTTSAPPGTTANPATKGKVAVAPPPKSSIFASLASAPKKPGTSNAERAAAAAKERASSTASPSLVAAQPVKKPNSGKESPPRNGGSAPVTKAATASSFMGLLADMEKKPEKETKKEDEIPNETEEQKAKRLRKEARRKLRVTWKVDAELVETRLFTHDPDEELDQGDRLKRDAGDTGREGEALKLHKNLDDLDDEEDEDSFEELEPYAAPSEVDFNYLEDVSLGDDSPHKINSPKFGGSMKPESPSSEAQNKYEQDTLMALYTSKADRPSTPKEPDDSNEDEGDFEPAEPETPFGEPDEKTRQREKEYLARQGRTQPAIDLAAQMQALSASQTSQQQPGAIPPELQRALSMFGRPNQLNQPSTTPQAAPSSNVTLQALLQTVLGQQSQGQNQQPQYPAASQPSALGPNLGALLASMQQGTQAATPANTLPLSMGGNPNPYIGNFDDTSRKHGRSDSNDNDNDHGRKGGTKKKKGDSKPYLYKTQTCTFWEQGKCLKGDSCTYRHGDEDEH